MKIQCQSCQAKYTIADEKVLGKVVKIRCKKCSSTIVINGNEQQPQADDAAETHVFDYATQGGDQWTVNVADGDQRTMTVAEISAEYRNGVINEETYCWKDGMADWLPLREIDQIYAAVKGGATEASVAPEPAAAPAAAAPLFAGGGGSTESPFAAKQNGNGAALFAGGGGAAAEQHAPAAARRAGGRAQGADLFGNVEKAGGEDDVMTSAQTAAIAANAAAATTGSSTGGGLPPATSSADEKLTGQRNENSVLFSLSALTDKKDSPGGKSDLGGSSGGGGSINRTTASADGSGLIDIRALSAGMDEDKSKNAGARVDDIMNLSGGGAFGAALAAPILAPPPLEPVDLGVSTSAEPAPKQSKTLIFAILGGCAFIAVGIVVAVMMMKSPGDEKKADNNTKTSSSAGETASASPTGTTTDTSGSGTPSGIGSLAMNDPAPPGTGNTASKGGAPAAPAGKPAGGGKPVAHGGGETAGGGAAPPPTGAPATPAAPAQPKDLAGAMGDAVGDKKPPAAPAGGGSTAPFDRGAAQAALGAVNVSSCKKGDGPSGAGHVTITFGPDGQVQTAIVDQGPFPGTAVGGCIAGKFRGAHVPPFGGAPVRVGKSFTL